MQVTETLSQGLKREYDISLPASDLASKLDGQLAELKAKVRINGFRPGKVPVEHLRKVYGKSVMADVVQEAIASANKKIVDDNHLRLAREPKVELPSDQAAIEAALEARGDLNFKVALEVLPVFEIGDFSQISLERLTADVEPADVETALDRLAEERRTYSEKPGGRGGRDPRPRHHRLRRNDRRRSLRGRRRAGTSRWRWARTRSCLGSRTSLSASPRATSAQFARPFLRLTPCERWRGRPPISR